MSARVSRFALQVSLLYIGDEFCDCVKSQHIYRCPNCSLDSGEYEKYKNPPDQTKIRRVPIAIIMMAIDRLIRTELVSFWECWTDPTLASTKPKRSSRIG